MLAPSTRIVAVVALLTLATGARPDDSPPREIVAQLDATLLAVLEDADALGYDGRLERLAPAVAAAFDLDFMAEKSLGRHWKGLTEEDGARWRALFRELMAANYAANLDEYTGQRFELLEEAPAAQETVVVRTQVVAPDAQPVELSYRLHRAPAGWRIIDVYLKGTVSELALRRSDYSSVMAREGFEALVSSVRRKIRDLATGKGRRSG